MPCWQHGAGSVPVALAIIATGLHRWRIDGTDNFCHDYSLGYCVCKQLVVLRSSLSVKYRIMSESLQAFTFLAACRQLGPGNFTRVQIKHLKHASRLLLSRRAESPDLPLQGCTCKQS
jgi:hypothetical protein